MHIIIIIIIIVIIIFIIIIIIIIFGMLDFHALVFYNEFDKGET